MIKLIRPYGIKEIAKTGITTIRRGQNTL
ncbi:MAG: hypothetical protein J6S29_00980 [Methanosphaera sp.]|nr:hypothetical protein [Methanosphaera sp.]